MTGLRARAAMTFIAVMVGACRVEGDGGSGRLITAHVSQPLAEGQGPTRFIGQTCLRSNDECYSGQCFHYETDPESGWLCTQVCTSDGECPLAAGWRCNEFYPGYSACAPPIGGWQPRNALLPPGVEE